MSRPLKRIPIPEPKRRRPPPPKDPVAKRETSSTPVPATSNTPQGAYVDYKLTSSRHSDKKWDVFKLLSHHDAPIDLNSWPVPIKLNRKDFKSRNEVEESAGPLTPMLGPDGKPVIGPDGKIVMLNADGTRVKKEEDDKGKKKGKEDPKKKAFIKKTRQVHMIPEDVRAFRKEHRKDWLLEDNGGGLAANQSWSGKYSDANDKQIYAFFAPVTGNDKEFRFIPVHRFYNFTKNNNVNTERVESQHARMQAAKNNARTKPKKEEEEEDKPMRGMRKLRIVNTGSERYADEDHKPHLGGEGDYDEMEYEDEVQDDEEAPPDLPQDEEEKEAAERQKREYLRDKVSARVEPETDDDDDDDKGYTEDGRQLKKLMKKMLAENESDDDKNPYADSDDEDEEETKPEQPPAIGVMPSTPNQSGASTPRPTQGSQQSQPPSQSQKPSQNGPASNNPALRATSPSMGGSALLAQRATSPHPIRKSPSVGTPGSANRATTPLSSTAVPTPGSGGKKRKEHPSERAGTPTPPQKRPTPTPQSPSPATPGAAPGGQKKKKSKHDLVAPNGDPLPEVITEEHAIEYLRKMGGAVQTSECITYFKRALKHDPENQKRLTDALKKVSTQAQKGYIKLNAPWANA